MSRLNNSHQILVVEDQPLISMDLEHALDQAGFSTELQFSNTGALTWLSTHKPDLAILDIGLREGSSERVAMHLASQHVPFIVYSGSAPSDAASVFENVKWIRKPADPTLVTKHVEELLLLGEFQKDMEERG
ncbi:MULTISPECIES: response regulator [unclassified Rhizobium]|uniref:response regulator n=1 Tax=unclassified Rhizobium TaxID=2613769 RepID=UPI000A4CAB30|nr:MULTISPECIES: response regulator [unclassified Rhizobium]